jgi:hypothetical protein
MAERSPPSAAAALYPNLKSGTPDVVQQRQQPTLADALYPSLAPKPKPPAPKPTRSIEEIRDWSHVDPGYARLVGLVPKGEQ